MSWFCGPSDQSVPTFQLSIDPFDPFFASQAHRPAALPSSDESSSSPADDDWAVIPSQLFHPDLQRASSAVSLSSRPWLLPVSSSLSDHSPFQESSISSSSHSSTTSPLHSSPTLSDSLMPTPAPVRQSSEPWSTSSTSSSSSAETSPDPCALRPAALVVEELEHEEEPPIHHHVMFGQQNDSPLKQQNLRSVFEDIMLSPNRGGRVRSHSAPIFDDNADGNRDLIVPLPSSRPTKPQRDETISSASAFQSPRPTLSGFSARSPSPSPFTSFSSSSSTSTAVSVSADIAASFNLSHVHLYPHHFQQRAFGQLETREDRSASFSSLAAMSEKDFNSIPTGTVRSDDWFSTAKFIHHKMHRRSQRFFARWFAVNTLIMFLLLLMQMTA